MSEPRGPYPHEAVLFVWRKDQPVQGGPFILTQEAAKKLIATIEEEGGIHLGKCYVIETMIDDAGRKRWMYFSNVEGMVIDMSVGLVSPNNTQVLS